MDELILAITKALAKNSSLENIHDACLAKGWKEEDIFLAIKAGQNLHRANVKQEAELKQRPAPFGRKS